MYYMLAIIIIILMILMVLTGYMVRTLTNAAMDRSDDPLEAFIRNQGLKDVERIERVYSVTHFQAIMIALKVNELNCRRTDIRIQNYIKRIKNA